MGAVNRIAADLDAVGVEPAVLSPTQRRALLAECLPLYALTQMMRSLPAPAPAPDTTPVFSVSVLADAPFALPLWFWRLLNDLEQDGEVRLRVDRTAGIVSGLTIGVRARPEALPALPSLFDGMACTDGGDDELPGAA